MAHARRINTMLIPLAAAHGAKRVKHLTRDGRKIGWRAGLFAAMVFAPMIVALSSDVAAGEVWCAAEQPDLGAFAFVPSLATETARIGWKGWPYRFAPKGAMGIPDLWARSAEEKPPAWAQAHRKPPMTASETRVFIKRLAQYVFDHHMKKVPDSAQRGMIYEYFNVARKGEIDQFIEGDALDTMHDGAWFAAAMANAYRATGDEFYKQVLAEWQLPFYCKMLNRSDKLFKTGRDDSRPDTKPFGREWALQPGEKGFVPYWWDDGYSVSLDRWIRKEPLSPYPCVDNLAGKPNPNFVFDGYSLGCSNHMAQDLGVMLQLAWLLFKDGKTNEDSRWAAEIAEAARNLHESRVRHHGVVPMCAAPAALATGDTVLMQKVRKVEAWPGRSAYYRNLCDFTPSQRGATPSFADDQQYVYYYGVARDGLTRELAFRTIYDALTEPMGYRYHSDDAEVPPGINQFDLGQKTGFLGGKPDAYRSDRKQPGGRPRPLGSRMGPQNMICCGWALQILKEQPGIWEELIKRFADDLRVFIDPTAEAQDCKAPLARADLGTVSVELASNYHALIVKGELKGDAAELRLYSRPDRKGSCAIVTMTRDRTLKAANDKGEALVVAGKIAPAGDSVAFEIGLPYTVVKGQKTWANGVEHGRCSIAVGDAYRNLYFASSEADVKRRLEHELAGGLRTWEAIFDEMGFIPTGIGTGQHWDGWSDTGGYAHLISAASQWLLYLEGRKDWEVHNYPAARGGK